MPEKRKRIPTPSMAEPLMDSPFARALGRLEGALPPGPAAPAAVSKAAPVPWKIEKTRKGGWPLAVERRGGGKEVTILRNVSGDLKALLRELQKTCGAGGTAREDSVEIQGSHIAAIARFLEGRPR
ncbi:MAG: translation initiation factor [Candidatus Hydrogenedentes bacterium]|nr:translation initiation factor [Candidatus Hydrogenedentota bacterium]